MNFTLGIDLGEQYVSHATYFFAAFTWKSRKFIEFKLPIGCSSRLCMQEKNFLVHVESLYDTQCTRAAHAHIDVSLSLRYEFRFAVFQLSSALKYRRIYREPLHRNFFVIGVCR